MRTILSLLILISVSLPGRAAEPQARWWKGNLHTHSLWSDGDDYPEMIAEWYKNRGYHFLALSDHNVLSDEEHWLKRGTSPGAVLAFEKYMKRWGQPWVERREGEAGEEVRLKMLSEFRGRFEEPERFLMVQSEEITTARVHMNATNVREKILPYTANKTEESAGIVATMQRVVNAVLDQRKRLGVPMFAHVNHPNFRWSITAEELMQVDNERFFEVYNGHPLVGNAGDSLHAGTERVWDIVNTERLAVLGKDVMFGLASDDSHHYHGEAQKLSHPGRGWVMVRAPKLEVDALIAALEAGDFYASSGVTLKDVRCSKASLSVEIEPEPGVSYRTEFIGTRRGYDAKHEAVNSPEDGGFLRVTQHYSADIGKVLSSVEGPSASYAFQGDEIYVRARVISSRLKADPTLEGEFEQAWVQPQVPGR